MTTYHVSPDGSDGNSGSESSAFATIGQAVDQVAAGDTIYLRGGVHEYGSQIQIRDKEGDASNPIVLAGYPDESAVLDFGGRTPGGWDGDGGLLLDGTKYWQLENFTLRNCPYIGIKLQNSGTTNNLIRNVRVHHCNLVGIGCYYGASDNIFDSCVSHDNYDVNTGGGDADGIQCYDADSNTIRNCVLYNNSDDGLDLYKTSDCTITNSVSYDNGYDDGDGTGFKLGGGDSADSGGHRVERCVAYDNSGVGFSHNHSNTPIEVFNNTSYNSGDVDYWFEDVEHVLRNNIAYQGGTYIESVVDDQSNSWNLGLGDPQFKSTNSTDDQFLHLSSESGAIDNGVDVGLEYNGTAPDLGAYELQTDTETGTTVKYHDGTGWQSAKVHYHDGTSFTPATIHEL